MTAPTGAAAAREDKTSRLHGIQSWIALLDGREECEPAFEHVAAAALPKIAREGVEARIILGDAFGQRSPVTTYSDTLYLELALEAGAEFECPPGQAELSAYVVSGSVRIDGRRYDAGTMVVARPDRLLGMRATTSSSRCPNHCRYRVPARRGPVRLLHSTEKRTAPNGRSACAHPESSPVPCSLS